MLYGVRRPLAKALAIEGQAKMVYNSGTAKRLYCLMPSLGGQPKVINVLSHEGEHLEQWTMPASWSWVETIHEFIEFIEDHVNGRPVSLAFRQVSLVPEKASA